MGSPPTELDLASGAAETTMTPELSSSEDAGGNLSDPEVAFVGSNWAPELFDIVAEIAAIRRICEAQSAEIIKLREESVWLAADLRAAQARLGEIEAFDDRWRRWVNVRSLRAVSVAIVVILFVLVLLDSSVW